MEFAFVALPRTEALLKHSNVVFQPVPLLLSAAGNPFSDQSSCNLTFSYIHNDLIDNSFDPQACNSKALPA